MLNLYTSIICPGRPTDIIIICSTLISTQTDLPSVAKWTVKANFDKFQLRSISSWNLAGNGQPNLMKICGIISGITAVTQYT